MLFVECVLLCFRSHMCKKTYKTLIRIVFVHMNSPNPYIYCCKLLAMHVSRWKCFKPVILKRFEKVRLRSAAGWRGCCFTLCVCFCVVPSLNRNENPLVVPPLLGKNMLKHIWLHHHNVLDPRASQLMVYAVWRGEFAFAIKSSQILHPDQEM